MIPFSRVTALRAEVIFTTRSKIVGILKPTGTADDRALFMNIEGFYLLPGHALSPEGEKTEAEGERTKTKEEEEAEEKREHEQERELERQLESGTAKPLPVEQREVTSILVLCNSPLGPEYLNFKINKGKAALPKRSRRRGKWACS